MRLKPDSYWAVYSAKYSLHIWTVIEELLFYALYNLKNHRLKWCFVFIFCSDAFKLQQLPRAFILSRCTWFWIWLKPFIIKGIILCKDAGRFTVWYNSVQLTYVSVNWNERLNALQIKGIFMYKHGFKRRYNFKTCVSWMHTGCERAIIKYR